MAKRKACKRCKIFVTRSECPVCKTSNFSTNWNGRVHFLNAKESMIAEKIDVHTDGEYAIKVK